LNDAEVRLQVKIDDNSANKTVDSLSKKTDGLSKSFTNAGKTLTAGLTVPISALSTIAIKNASDLNETMNKVEVAFGDNADEVKSWGDTTIKQFGIAKGTALDMASLYGDMATGMGVNTKEASKLSTNLTGLAGDLASFKNVSIDVAKTALAGVFTGETESLKQLGIIMTQTNLEQFALSKGITKSMDKMTEAEKIQLRYAFVVDRSKNAVGDFARTSDSTANQTRIAGETFKELTADLGQQLLPQFNKLLSTGIKIMDWFRGLTDEQKKLIITIAKVLAVIGPALIIIVKLVSFGSKAIETFGKLKNVFSILNKSLIKLIASTFKFTVALLSNPITWIVIGIVALIAIIILLIKYWDNISAVVGKVFANIANFFKELWGNIKSFFGGIFNTIGQFFSNLFKAIGSFFSSVWNAIVSFMTPIISFIWMVIQKIIDIILLPYKILWNIFVLIIALVAMLLEGIYNVIAPIVVWIYNNILLPIFNFFVLVFKSIIDFIVLVIETIKNVFLIIVDFVWNNILTPIFKFFVTIFTAIVNFIVGAIEVIKNVFLAIVTFIWNNILSPILNFFVFIFSKIWDFITGVIDKIKNGFKSMVDFVKSIFQTVADFIGKIFGVVGNIIKAPINAVIGLINGVLKGLNKIKVPDWVPGLGGMKVNFPLIPKLKVGTDNVLNEGLAYLHKGEKVVPASVEKGGFTGTNSMAKIYVEVGDINMDGKKVGRIMTPYITKTVKVSGGNS